MIKQYVKRPVVIEALEVIVGNYSEFEKFMGEQGTTWDVDSESRIYIKTLEGNMKISIGDYIIKGVNGEFYPCKPDIFKKTYDEKL